MDYSSDEDLYTRYKANLMEHGTRERVFLRRRSRRVRFRLEQIVEIEGKGKDFNRRICEIRIVRQNFVSLRSTKGSQKDREDRALFKVRTSIPRTRESLSFKKSQSHIHLLFFLFCIFATFVSRRLVFCDLPLVLSFSLASKNFNSSIH